MSVRVANAPAGTSLARESKLGVHIERAVPVSLRPFRRYFRGFERVPLVRELFGRSTERVLREL